MTSLTIPNTRAIYRHKIQKAERLQHEKDYAGALKIWRWYLDKIDPQDPDILFNAGVIIQAMASSPAERFASAEFYERILCSPQATPGNKADAMNNIGLLVEKVGETDKAAIAYAFALKMQPDHPCARINYGDTLRFANRLEEADEEYRKVLDMNPESATAHMSAAMVALLIGDFKRGWEEYEWRWKWKEFPTLPLDCGKPIWRGEDLNGKTILLTEEQGYGDAIMFIRYARELKARWDCTTQYHGSTCLMELFKGVVGLDKCFDRSDEEDFDYHCPLMSLPHRLGTTLDTIPATVPYIIATPSQRDTGLNVALCWAGSPRHGKDRFRSIEPELFQPIIDSRPDVRFYSLQVGPRTHEVGRLRGVSDLANEIATFSDTARALLRMDLVISVDTSLVHLAGALNVPTWMLTPNSPDFRWLMDRETSPWYPSLRLFRQQERGNWTETINRIIGELKVYGVQT